MLKTTSRLAGFCLAVIILGGCGGGGAAAGTGPAEVGRPALSAITISPPATSILVGTSVQLTATGLDSAGNTILLPQPPRFTSSDETVATVDAKGVVTGLKPASAAITAELTDGVVTRSASSLVTVSDAGNGTGQPPQPAPPTPPTPPTPPALPTAVTVSTPNRTFNPMTVTIAAGGTVTWLMIDDDHDVTFVGPAPTGGNVPETDEGTSVQRTFLTPGTYDYYCSEHLGHGMRGTVIVQGAAPPSPPPVQPPVTQPPQSPVNVTVTTPGSSFSPASVTIPVNGIVTWNISGATHNVTFTGAAPTGGNIPDTRGGSVSRSFTTAGTYSYQCTRHSGMTGRVVVQ